MSFALAARVLWIVRIMPIHWQGKCLHLLPLHQLWAHRPRRQSWRRLSGLGQAQHRRSLRIFCTHLAASHCSIGLKLAQRGEVLKSRSLAPTIAAKIITKHLFTKMTFRQKFRGNSFCNYYKNILHSARKFKKKTTKYYKNNCFRELFCDTFGQDAST